MTVPVLAVPGALRCVGVTGALGGAPGSGRMPERTEGTYTYYRQNRPKR
jgi:hypothetical protein